MIHKWRSRTIVVIFFSLVVLSSLLLIGCGTSDFALPVGVLKTSRNALLQKNINTFMEAQKGEDDIGKDHYACSNLLYGYDEKYAYAWVYCSGFVIKSNHELEPGTGWSIPTRLEYTLPHFQISSFTQPGDAGSAPTLQHLFPQSVFALANPSNAEIDALDQEVRMKVQMNTEP